RSSDLPPCSTIQHAPFSATPSTAGITQKSRSFSSCGSWIAPRSTLPASPGRSEAHFRAVLYSGISSNALASRPPTSITLFSNFSRRFPSRGGAKRDKSGRSSGAGAAASSAAMISSRADTFPPLRAEALLRHRRQLALPAPGIGQQRREQARQLAGDPVRPGMRQNPRADPRDSALVPGNQPARSQLSPPGEQLMVQIDPHRADVGAGAAQRGGE